MKKYKKSIIIVAIIVICVSLIAICGCNKIGEEAKFYKVTYLSGEGGYIDGQAEQTVESGKDGLTIVAVPDEGYRFVEWSDGVDTAERTDKNITTDLSVKALFEKVSCTVNYETDGNGTISGKSTQKIDINADGETVTAIPNKGYKFVAWSDGIDTAERTDKNITRDLSVKALFKKISCTINYETDGNGRIEGNENQTIKYGETATIITAIPNIGYRFVKWSDGLTEATRQDRNVTKDIVVKAIFEKQTFTLTYVAGVGGTIDGQSEQEIGYGEDAVFVVAVPQAGYKFVKWSDGNGSTIRRETNVVSEISVTAEFEFLYEGGEGTLLKPFTIANYTQLNDMWYYPESNYKLINDLDLSGISHEPIFDKIKFFKGNFDGNGHTVKNLTVETESNCPSLFGVSGGSISNLTIIDANIITADYDTLNRNDNYYVGILAGMVKGYVHDVNVRGKIVTNGFSYAGIAIGGLVGYANGTVANCSCNVQLDIKNIYSKSLNLPFVFGGMIGVCDSAFVRDCQAEGQIKITECYWTESGSTGDINKSAEIVAGGLIGYYFTARQADAYIRNCRTDVEIYGDNNYNAGGFVGYLDAVQDTILQITDCSVYGDVTCGRVGGFVYKAYSSSNSTLLFDKCIIENNVTAFSYGAGFVYFCQGSSGGDFQIKNCYTIGDIKTRGWFDAERIVGRASGFGWQMSYVSIVKSYAKRDIISSDGRGFSFYFSNSEIISCFYEGTIDISNGAGTLRGVGMFDIFSSSKLDNCYVNVNFVTGENNTSNLYALIRQGGGKISNFYCYGNYCKIFESYNMQNVSNGHVFKGNIDESNLPQEGDETNITIYESAEDMYYLANKLNEGQTEEVWINIEGELPKLKNLI